MFYIIKNEFAAPRTSIYYGKFFYFSTMQIYKGTYKYMHSGTLHNINGSKLMKIYLGQTLKPTKTLLK